VLADGERRDLTSRVPESGRCERGRRSSPRSTELLVVVDRLMVGAGARDRFADSVATAFTEGEGELIVIEHESGARHRFSERFRCPDHPDVRFVEPTPRLFSFNNPYGSCPTCTGFGAVLEYDEGLIVPDPARSWRTAPSIPGRSRATAARREKLLAFARKRRCRRTRRGTRCRRPSARRELIDGRDRAGSRA
jgi:excinuclease UvrABC ATPase subunit